VYEAIRQIQRWITENEGSDLDYTSDQEQDIDDEPSEAVYVQEILHADCGSEPDDVQAEGNIHDDECDIAGDREDDNCDSDNSEDESGSSKSNADSVTQSFTEKSGYAWKSTPPTSQLYFSNVTLQGKRFTPVVFH
jgi:hypothetical protein